MNRQRKVVITITYNEMGIIIDTKAEELDLSAQPEQRWIPVTERLPETNGQYLVTRWKGFSPKEMIIDIARYANGEWHTAYPIEAYMPLPEPYKEDENE